MFLTKFPGKNTLETFDVFQKNYFRETLYKLYLGNIAEIFFGKLYSRFLHIKLCQNFNQKTL